MNIGLSNWNEAVAFWSRSKAWWWLRAQLKEVPALLRSYFGPTDTITLTCTWSVDFISKQGIPYNFELNDQCWSAWSVYHPKRLLWSRWNTDSAAMYEMNRCGTIACTYLQQTLDPCEHAWSLYMEDNKHSGQDLHWSSSSFPVTTINK